MNAKLKIENVKLWSRFAATAIILHLTFYTLHSSAATMLNYMPGTNEVYTALETDAAIESAINYTDGVASQLYGDIAQKASYYKYEGGAASNILVSCDWWMSSSYTLRERADLGEDTWRFAAGELRPPRFGGPTYELTYRAGVGWVLEYGSASQGMSFVTNNQDRAASTLTFDGGFTLVRTNEVWDASTNRWPVVYADELAAVTPGNYETVSNRAMSALQSFDEDDPTVPDWAKEDNKPSYSAGEVGAYPATSGQTLEGNVSMMGAQLNTIGSTLNAEDAKLEITNYNSQVHLPEASFWVKILNEATGSNEWLLAWSEMTRWSWFLGIFGTYTNDVNAALGNKSEKEYAFYDGVTGNPAPDGFFWISQPRVAVCAGMAYQRCIDAQSEVWVLESNGMVADVNGTTNGFFRITDSEDEVQFEIIKGNRRTLAAAPRTMTSTVMGITHYFTSYATTNAVSNPIARFKRDLQSGTWYEETEADCPMNTSWTDKGGGVYEVEWWPKSTEPKMFMSAVYETGGSTRIVQRAPVQMEKLIIGGVEYIIGTAVIDGTRVLTLTEAL